MNQSKRKYRLLEDLSGSDVAAMLDEIEELPCDVCGSAWITCVNVDRSTHDFKHSIPREGDK